MAIVFGEEKKKRGGISCLDMRGYVNNELSIAEEVADQATDDHRLYMSLGNY